MVELNSKLLAVRLWLLVCLPHCFGPTLRLALSAAAHTRLTMLLEYLQMSFSKRFLYRITLFFFIIRSFMRNTHF